MLVRSVFDVRRIYGMKPRNVGWRKHCAIHPNDSKSGIEMTDCDDGFCRHMQIPTSQRSQRFPMTIMLRDFSGSIDGPFLVTYFQKNKYIHIPYQDKYTPNRLSRKILASLTAQSDASST